MRNYLRSFFVALLVLAAPALSGCGVAEQLVGGGNSASSTPIASPAPLAKTTIDDVVLRDAWLSYEIALDAIEVARLAGAPKLKPGSPTAIKIADANDKVLAAFLAAENIADGLSTADPIEALTKLRQALTEFRAALRSN